MVLSLIINNVFMVKVKEILDAHVKEHNVIPSLCHGDLWTVSYTYLGIFTLYMIMLSSRYPFSSTILTIWSWIGLVSRRHLYPQVYYTCMIIQVVQ